ncbi:unnamed protein product [Rotaria sordida]|uniref:Uncharacterized protein n=1 Tax=Rotaria sordida TaxID=392033 RepID=A0A814UB91_9BILA|nr:unnamed protein product [Rotaria sordida]CAF1172390.1 unnamed protein product [Rotaria sordida]CAF1429122.1 unnamed protein product [Rotaria sordida]
MNKSSSISSNRNSIPISACGDVKRFKSENSNLCTRVCVKKPEDIIICEKQEEHYCGRHVLRVLSQRLDLFCDEYLIEVVQNITAAEQICRSAIHLDLFVVAGGSVVLSLLMQAAAEKGSDVDLFFLKENPKMFRRAVNELEARLQNSYFVRHIVNGKDFTTSVVMQLTRPTTTYTTISRIIHSFDLDICAAAFNSKQVIISFSCLQALNSGHATCYALPISSSEFVRRVSRLFKYQQRGFNILCPKEFDINAFLATAVEDCKEIRSERIYRFRRQHFGDNCGSFSIQRNSVNIIIEINFKNM